MKFFSRCRERTYCRAFRAHRARLRKEAEEAERRLQTAFGDGVKLSGYSAIRAGWNWVIAEWDDVNDRWEIVGTAGSTFGVRRKIRELKAKEGK